MKRAVFHSTTFRLTIFLSSILLLFVGSFLYKNVWHRQPSESLQKEFDRFLDELFLTEMENDPLSLHFLIKNEDAYGLQTRALFEPYSEETEARSLQHLKTVKEKLTAFPFEKLSLEQQQTYDCLLFLFDNSIELSEYSELSNPLSPQSGVQQQLPFLLSEYRFDSRDDVENYLALLDSVYSYFESLCPVMLNRVSQNTIPAVAIQKSAVQCYEFLNTPQNENILLTSFSERLSRLEHLDEIETAVYEMKNRYRVETEIIPAYRLLYEALSSCASSLPSPDPLGLSQSSADTSGQSFGLSALHTNNEYYTLLAQRAASTDMTVPQMKELLEQYYNNALAHMKSLAGQNPDLAQNALNGSFLDGTSLYSVVSSGNSADTLRFLQQNSRSLLPALSKAQNLHVTLKTTSPTLQKMSAPALYLLSPLDSYLEHTVYLNPAYSGSTSYTTIAHETFPGHLSARVCFLSGNPHPIRAISDFIGWDEGWASLAELYALSFLNNHTQETSNDTLDFLCSYETASLCLYGLSDIGIHYDGWNRQDTIIFWCKHGLDEEIANSLWELVVSEPAYYLPYSMGLVQMLELRKLAMSSLGDNYTESGFCSALHSLGPMPYPICEQYLPLRLSD